MSPKKVLPSTYLVVVRERERGGFWGRGMNAHIAQTCKHRLEKFVWVKALFAFVFSLHQSITLYYLSHSDVSCVKHEGSVLPYLR